MNGEDAGRPPSRDRESGRRDADRASGRAPAARANPQSAKETAPPLSGVHEAALYVSDLERAERFWSALGLRLVGRAPGRHVFFRAGDDLLLFDPRGTAAGGRVPGHGALGPGHVALSVPDASVLERWRVHLRANGVEVESEVEWPKGGRSLYFRDPDGNSLELITRGSWGFPKG